MKEARLSLLAEARLRLRHDKAQNLRKVLVKEILFQKKKLARLYQGGGVLTAFLATLNWRAQALSFQRFCAPFSAKLIIPIGRGEKKGGSDRKVSAAL